jgi:GNAT superfamily N-acetyltransferase
MATTIRETRSRHLDGSDATALAALSARLGGSETEAQWSSFLGRPNAVALCAISDGSVVGYAAGEIRTGFGLPAPVAWVEAFGVDLHHRGAGTGRALLIELLREFADAGAGHVYTLVPVHDGVLGPFFRQHGFRDAQLRCLGTAL